VIEKLKSKMTLSAFWAVYSSGNEAVNPDNFLRRAVSDNGFC